MSIGTAFNLYSIGWLSVWMVCQSSKCTTQTNFLIRDCISCRWTTRNKPFVKPIHDRIHSLQHIHLAATLIFYMFVCARAYGIRRIYGSHCLVVYSFGCDRDNVPNNLIIRNWINSVDTESHSSSLLLCDSWKLGFCFFISSYNCSQFIRQRNRND